MTKRILDFNPVTGETVFFEYVPHEDKMVLTHSQDCSIIRDQALSLASDTDRSKKGIKDDMWHYARIPYTVLMEMKQKYGVNFNDRNDRKRFFELLNTVYKDLKTTHMVHNERN